MRHNNGNIPEHDFDWVNGVLMLFITAIVLSQGADENNQLKKSINSEDWL